MEKETKAIDNRNIRRIVQGVMNGAVTDIERGTNSVLMSRIKTGIDIKRAEVGANIDNFRK